MKITKKQLVKIIKEEYAAVKELGPATGHEEGTAPLQALQEVIAGLAEVAGIMKASPSDRPASEFSGYMQSISRELQAVFDELSSAAPMQEEFDQWTDMPELEAVHAAVDVLEDLKTKIDKGYHSTVTAAQLELNKVQKHMENA